MKITNKQLKQIIKEELEAVMDEGKFMDYNREMENIYGDEAMAQQHADRDAAESNLKVAVDELQSLLDYAGPTGMPAELEDLARELEANVAKAKAALATMRE